MNLESDYSNYLEEIRKAPKKSDIKLILADKLIEDGYSGMSRLVQWLAKKEKWPGICNEFTRDYEQVIINGYDDGDVNSLSKVEYSIIHLLMNGEISGGKFYFKNELKFLEKLANSIDLLKGLLSL